MSEASCFLPFLGKGVQSNFERSTVCHSFMVRPFFEMSARENLRHPVRRPAFLRCSRPKLSGVLLLYTAHRSRLSRLTRIVTSFLSTRRPQQRTCSVPFYADKSRRSPQTQESDSSHHASRISFLLWRDATHVCHTGTHLSSSNVGSCR